MAGDRPFDLTGSRAVVALPAPLSVQVRFVPALPPKLAASLAELPMGLASKLAVPTAGEPRPRALQDVEVPFWCYAALGSEGRPRRVLTSFAGSPQAQETLRTAWGDPAPWLDRLRRMNPDVAFIGEPHMIAWVGDPLAGGSYSAFDNRSVDRSPLFQQVHWDGRLAFAGEHTAGPWSGTMEGAVRSGQRSASQVAQGQAQ